MLLNDEWHWALDWNWKDGYMDGYMDGWIHAEFVWRSEFKSIIRAVWLVDLH